MAIIYTISHRESVAGSVIQATRTVEFEDGLSPPWKPGALVVAAPILESILKPPGGAGWSLVGCG